MAEKLMDAPNQQSVRPDGSAPWHEGKGGSTHDKGKTKEKPKDDKPESRKD